MGEAETKRIWRLVVAAVVVVGILVMAGGLYVYVSSGPELRARRVAQIELSKDEPGAFDVCLDDGEQVNCYVVPKADRPAFGEPGSCVLVRFIGEGPIRALRHLNESRCRRG